MVERNVLTQRLMRAFLQYMYASQEFEQDILMDESSWQLANDKHSSLPRTDQKYPQPSLSTESHCRGVVI